MYILAKPYITPCMVVVAFADHGNGNGNSLQVWFAIFKSYRLICNHSHTLGMPIPPTTPTDRSSASGARQVVFGIVT